MNEISAREKLLSPDEVSAWTGISTAALAGLRYTGKGPVFLKPTERTVRYRERDVQAWLDASARQITGAVV